MNRGSRRRCPPRGPRGPGGPGARPERGAVTAELAMVLPLLLAVVVAMTWLLSVGMAQLLSLIHI